MHDDTEQSPLTTNNSDAAHDKSHLIIPWLSTKKVPALLVTIMIVILLLVTTITISLLYDTAFEQQRMRLTEVAKSQAAIMSAVGRFDDRHSQDAHPSGSEAATLSQFIEAHESYDGFGKTGELVLAKRDHTQIRFLLRHRHHDLDNPKPIPFSSHLAEPMKRALDGKSGTLIGLDYRGAKVLAAHEYVDNMNWGVVAKIDLAEIRAPFIEAAIIASFAAAILIFIGTVFFMRISYRIVHKLEESEAHYKGILHGAVDGIITIDENGCILSLNSAARSMFNYDNSELIGLSIVKIIPPKLAKENRNLIKSCFESGTRCEITHPIELTAQCKDKSEFPVEMTSSIIQTSHNIVYTWILRDITLRRTLELELKQHQQNLEKLISERTAQLSETINKLNNTQSQLIQNEKLASIGQLAAGVAHEINNPVGYVNSNVTSLRSYLDDIFELIELYQNVMAKELSDKAVVEIETMKKNIDLDFIKKDINELISESLEGISRVKEIVYDLKGFSRAGNMDWELASLHKGINSTLNIVYNELKYKATIKKEYGKMPDIECMPAQLNQVFMNLLVNAGHAIDKQGVITIRTGSTDKEVWVEIQDTGIGIPQENIKKIFDPFYTTKAIGQGTGLGLSLSYSIIKRHNGRIDVNSEPEKGTRFRIWLPIKHTSDNEETSLSQAKVHYG